MKIFDDLYVYPWLSYEANNCNTIFIDGKALCANIYETLSTQ